MSTAAFSETDPWTYQTAFSSSYTPGTITAPTVDSARRSRVDAILVENLDTIAHTVVLSFGTLSSGVEFASVTVAAGAGTPGTPMVDVLAAVVPANVVGIAFEPDKSIAVGVSEAISATKAVGIFWIGGYLP